MKIKGDAWKVVENIPEADLIRRDGLDVVLKALDQVYQDEPEVDLISRMGEFLFDEAMVKRAGELMAEYCSRVLAKHDKLISLGAGLPDTWVGVLLQHRAGLDSDDRRGLMNFTRGDISSNEIAKGLKKLADQKKMDQKTRGYLRQGRPTFRPGLRHGGRQRTVLEAIASGV